IAARAALSLADYVVTEAGFGADLGAEKFFDIFSRTSGIYPDAVVLVATIRALKMHGRVRKEHLGVENLNAITEGFANLRAHINNIKKFNRTPIVALNLFSTDTPKEIEHTLSLLKKENVQAVISEGWAKGSNGCKNLAKTVIKSINLNLNENKLLYEDKASLKEKIRKLAKEIYNADAVSFSSLADKNILKFTRWGFGNLPICMAKTQNSISHDKTLLGAPAHYIFPITDIRLSAGAGFIVAYSGEINTMPGLPPVPAAEKIDVDENGTITGLF
ncbi:MAG: formate--tetrahydrofolate ligase, partial [Alphaproteobacteria bacterium]|nr:formate--tetrahydrofolate ligase [Alphaproteobacteria bacterium]